MDSERRHELEQNSLAQALSRAPAFLWEYGSYLLLGVAVVVALYFFFQTRTAADLNRRQAEAASLYNLNAALERARRTQQMAGFFPADQLAREEAEVAGEMQSWFGMPAESERDGVRAHAYRLRGDIAWTLADLAAVREAAPATAAEEPAGDAEATEDPAAPAPQPVLPQATATRSSQEWLQESETAYRRVIDAFPRETAENLAALFGLAAIAEQRGQFEEAEQHYDRLIARGDVGDGAKRLARQRKRLASQLSLSPRLAAAQPPEIHAAPDVGGEPEAPAEQPLPDLGEQRPPPRDPEPPVPDPAPAGQPE